jgi:hypothetical protein
LLLLVLIPDERSMTVDVRYYLDVASAIFDGDQVSGWEYPPLAVALTLAPLLLGLSDFSSYLLGFACLCLVLDFLTVRALGVVGRGDLRGVWLWIAGVPLLGLISITRIDMAACCAAAAGVAALERRHSRRAGAFVALGAAVKVWPGLFFLMARPLRFRPALVGAGAALASSVLVGALLFTDHGTRFVTYQADRGIQVESLPALPLLWAHTLGLATYESHFDFGSQQLHGPGVGIVAVASTVLSGVVTVLCIVAAWRRQGRGDGRWVDLAAVAVTALVLVNKVLSTQYLLWVLVMVALVTAADKRFRPPVLATMLALVLSHLVFPYLYRALIDLEPVPVVALTLRDGCLFFVLATLVRHARQEAKNPQSGEQATRGFTRERRPWRNSLDRQARG